MKTQFCLGLQTKHAILTYTMLKPRLRSLWNGNKNFSTPEWTYSGRELIAGPGREDRDSYVCWISSSGNQAHLFSVFCYTEQFLSTEKKKKNKNLYFCGCNTLVADISQQFHSVSWISFTTLSPSSSLPLLSFTEAFLTPSHYQSAPATPSPTPSHPSKRGRGWVWILGEKLFEQSGSFHQGRQELVPKKDHPS